MAPTLGPEDLLFTNWIGPRDRGGRSRPKHVMKVTWVPTGRFVSDQYTSIRRHGAAGRGTSDIASWCEEAHVEARVGRDVEAPQLPIPEVDRRNLFQPDRGQLGSDHGRCANVDIRMEAVHPVLVGQLHRATVVSPSGSCGSCTDRCRALALPSRYSQWN